MSDVLPQDAIGVTKVLLLGNSGVGKSLLLNTVLERSAFESRMSVAAVTKAVETQPFRDADGRPYLLYNIPGLIDVDEQIALENAAIIEQAIRDRADLPTIAFFVLTVEGGRLRAEDMEAWQAIAEFVPDIKDPSCLAFIVNKVCFDDYPQPGQLNDFRLGLEHTLARLCGKTFSVCVLPNVEGKTERDDFGSESMLKMRKSLVALFSTMGGRALSPKGGARLLLHEQRLREEIAAMKRFVSEAARESERKAAANEAEQKKTLGETRRRSRVSVLWRPALFGGVCVALFAFTFGKFIHRNLFLVCSSYAHDAFFAVTVRRYVNNALRGLWEAQPAWADD